MSRDIINVPEKSFPATDLTRNSSEILHEAKLQPVTITQYRKPRYVMMSIEEFERITTTDHTTQKSFRSDQLPDDLYAGFMSAIDDELSQQSDD